MFLSSSICRELYTDLTLRSTPKACVSKGGIAHRACCPSFETHRCAMLLRMRENL